MRCRVWPKTVHVLFEVCNHRAITKIPTCAVNRGGTAQNGCQPRIMAFDLAITVNDTSDIGCQPRVTAFDLAITN